MPILERTFEISVELTGSRGQTWPAIAITHETARVRLAFFDRPDAMAYALVTLSPAEAREMAQEIIRLDRLAGEVRYGLIVAEDAE